MSAGLGHARTAPNRNSVRIEKAAGWADFNVTFDLCEFPGEVVRVVVCDDGGIAVSGTNYLSATLVKVDIATVTERTISTLINTNTGGTALTASVPHKATIATTEHTDGQPHRAYKAGDYLRLKFDGTGTAPALNLVVTVTTCDFSTSGRGAGSVS